ncbi:MAG TPA: glycosyltransferase family 4 protein [Steroidobacter sp.]|uniref:glycosyltransferase family 4 protein n=1 Tax=Steroidobacter sp. TaxID=1978227 RepID=UPI002ED96186
MKDQDEDRSGPRAASASQQARAGIEPPTLLFVVNVGWFFISHRLPLARAARAAGYDVHVLTEVHTPQEAAVIEDAGLVLHHLPGNRGGLNPLADLGYFLRLLMRMRKVAPALVHNVTVKPVLYGTLAARLLGIRAIVNSISGLGYVFTGKSRRLLAALVISAYRWILRRPHIRVIVQNEDDAWLLESKGAIHRQQVMLIRGAGVDLQIYSAPPEPSTAVPLVVFPARILKDKGVLEFIAAAKLLLERGCKARFVLAGPVDPYNPAALSAEALERLLSGTSIEWLGQVDDMPQLYGRANIVCLPSYREGMPKALLEACAAARAIVTTDVPGCRDVVTHEENGLLVPVRDERALADALQRLIEDSELRRRLGSAGRRRAEQEFDLKIILRQTLQLYRQALEPTR